jgi:hypothetical protein
MAYPFLEPLLDRVARALNNSPDFVVLIFVLIVAAIVLQLLVWVRRVIMWWTNLAFRLVFWLCLGLFISMVWQRGFEASLRDAVVIGGKIMGYAAVVKDIWLREYRKYEAQTRAGGGTSRNR